MLYNVYAFLNVYRVPIGGPFAKVYRLSFVYSPEVGSHCSSLNQFDSEPPNVYYFDTDKFFNSNVLHSFTHLLLSYLFFIFHGLRPFRVFALPIIFYIRFQLLFITNSFRFHRNQNVNSFSIRSNAIAMHNAHL